MRLSRPIQLAWTLSLAFGSALGQQAGSGAPADGGTTEVLQSIFIPSKTDAPFTLTLATEWIQPLADGNTLTVTNRRKIVRDTRGRIMQERRLLMPPHGDQQTPLNWIQISDPEQHTLYNCSPAKRVCYLYDWGERQADPDMPEGSTVYPGATVATKDLGRDINAGVEVRGTRVTTTIEPGVIGNSKPIVVNREFWFSDALGFNLVSMRQDPRVGEQRFTVTDLSRNTPEAALFALPAGFSVIDERAPTPKESTAH